MTVIDEIAAERRRQIEEEGWTPEHDDRHRDGEMAQAAACYAACRQRVENVTTIVVPRDGSSAGWLRWPWSWSWWKPTTPRRDLIKAGALIVAEIERLDRRSRRATGS